MKVSELIAALKTLPPNMPVVFSQDPEGNETTDIPAIIRFADAVQISPNN
jgi:hypothetical protein